MGAFDLEAPDWGRIPAVTVTGPGTPPLAISKAFSTAGPISASWLIEVAHLQSGFMRTS